MVDPTSLQGPQFVAVSDVHNPGSWQSELQERCDLLIRQIVSTTTAEQHTAWSELFRLIALDLERWCQNSAPLRRAGLSNEDDWRAVFVRAVERIVKRDFANLHAYREHCDLRRARGTLGATPFEAWLRQLVRYAAADEVTRRLSLKRVQPMGGAGTVEQLGVQRTPAASLMTPIDRRQRSDAMRQAIGELDEHQRCALLQRLEGASYDEIAAALAMSEEQAQRLVRSAKARLRRSLRQRSEP